MVTCPTDEPVDVIVIGDGPAGAAIASACRSRGLDVVLIGSGAPWTHTYGVWVDDLAHLPAVAAPEPFASVRDRVVVVGRHRHELDRRYAVIDGSALRVRLLDGIRHVHDRVERVWAVGDQQRVGTASGVRAATHVVDATGAPARFAARPRRSGPGSAWQTAYGVVLPDPPPGHDAGEVTLMDFSPAHGSDDDLDPNVATFCYVVPVPDGWLVEETVLAARPAVAPERLRSRLARRLGPDGAALIASARRVETVRIPMGGPVPPSGGPVIPFGAAAGYVHPATGFSISTSLRSADRLAEALADGSDPWRAVWPASLRRSRALHEYGAGVILGLDADALRTFFDAFFELPVEDWSAFLRVDAAPAELAAAMRRVFSVAPWSVRRRLMSGDPRLLATPWRR